MERLAGVLLLLLAGCTWLVPDKEKEYLQSARQLPPLRLPEAEPRAPSLAVLKPPEPVPAHPPPPLSPPLAGTAPFIEIPYPYEHAWIAVIKALDRARLEIVGRDPERGVLRFLHAEAEAALSQDRGWWEDILYFFGHSARMREREYQAVLQPADGHTRLYLFDHRGVPLQDPQATELLQRIRQVLVIQDAP